MLLCELGYVQKLHNEMVERVRLQNYGIEDAIKALADGYFYLYPLEEYCTDINDGLCEDFAHDIISLFPESELYWCDDEERSDDPNSFYLPENYMVHAFVKYKGKFYDSDCPKGTKQWKKLPCIAQAIISATTTKP
jgi:hypothetical protein